MEHQISAKRILIDLISILPQIHKEFGDHERYKELITFLMAKDYYNDDEIPYPTLKQVSSDTHLKPHYIRKLLKEVYEKVFDYNFSFDFTKVEVYFHVDYLKRYASFKCKNMTNLPRIGENITLSFLRAKVGTDYFYVEDIRHNFEHNNQLIHIHLKGGIYNSYWYHRKHEALEKRELSYHDLIGDYDFQLKEKIGSKHY